MPSYRYTREIKPEDLQPAPAPRYSRLQRGSNWWHYHWKWVLALLAAAAAVFSFVHGILTRETPDSVVGVVSAAAWPEELASALAGQLAPMVGDLNGDGRELVRVEVYTIDAGELDSPNTGGPYALMAGVTKLVAAFEGSECIILMAEGSQAQIYQDVYGLFGRADGSQAPEGADVLELTVAFSDLTGLDRATLGFTGPDGTPCDGSALLAGYRVGLRALAGTKLEKLANGAANWRRGQAVLEALKGPATEN
jgi:hypothetical protein